MVRKRLAFWQGFAIGAGAGLGTFAAINLVARGQRPVVRLEKSIQIGKPVQEVFSAWNDFERLPRTSEIIEEVREQGNRSHWRIFVGGKRIEWDSEIEQFIPNEAVGWKSLNGPKHTGRISFSPVGNDTLVHVVMNYAPPFVLLRPLFPAVGKYLEKFIEQALRDFKATLEGKGQQGIEKPARATGTFGPGAERIASESARATGFRSAADVKAQTANPSADINPVEFTRPPEAKP